MGKAKPISDIKALPRWQKYTIIGILFLLVASFTISGAMVAVIDTITQPSNPPMGIVGNKEIKVEEFRKYVNFFEYYGQTADALPLLFAKFPIVTGTGEIKTKSGIRDSYYFDYLLEQIVNENPELQENEMRSKFLNSVVWHHFMLLELAKLEKIEVQETDAAEKARLIMVGKPDLRALDEDANADETTDNTTEGSENTEITEEVSEESQDYIMQQIEEREALYVTKCNEVNLKPEEVEKIVGEFIAVKTYMNKLIADNVAISYEDALKNIKTFKDEVKLQYLRINSEHPEITKRTKQKLADEIALSAVKRNLWESSNQMSGEELFENPLTRIYKRKIKDDEKNYHEPEYRFVVLSADFKKVESFVRLTDEMVEKFYEHYRPIFFENDRTEADINKEIEEQKKAFIAANKPADWDEKNKKKTETETDGEEAANPPDWAPEGGWSKWRKPIYDKLRYKTFAEVKAEAKELAIKLAAPKLAVSAMKSLDSEINDRIQKNTEALTAEKNRKSDVLKQYQNYENFYNGGENVNGLLPEFRNFETVVKSEIAGMKNRCSLSYDASDKSLTETVEAKVLQEAFEIGWDNIKKLGWQKILTNLKLTVNPYALQDNSIADLQNEIQIIENDIFTLTKRTDISALDELNKKTEILSLTKKRLATLILIRSELMKLYKKLTGKFSAGEDFVALYALDHQLSKGYIETYLDKFQSEVNGFFNIFITNTNLLEDVENLKLKVRELEINFKQYEAELDDNAKNMALELPPDKLLKIKTEGMAFDQYGLETFTIEKKELYKGLNINGMWGASISPFEYKRGLTLTELKDSEFLKNNLPFLMDSKEWNFEKNIAEGTRFELALKDMTPGSYSKAFGTPDVGIYIVFMLEKVEKIAPTLDEIKDDITKDYIRETAPEIGEEFANELLQILRKNINKIKDLTFEELLEMCKNHSTDQNFNGLIEEAANIKSAEAKDVVAQSQLASKMRISLMQKEFEMMAADNGLELMETDFVNYNSDIPDISYEGGNDNLLIREAINLEPLVEIGSIGKEAKPDPEHDGETKTSYLIFRLLDERAGQLKGSDVQLNEINEDELELLRSNLWAQKVINNDEISKVKELGKLIEMLKSKKIKVERYFENERDVEIDNKRNN